MLVGFFHFWQCVLKGNKESFLIGCQNEWVHGKWGEKVV